MTEWITLGGSDALTYFSTVVWVSTMCMGQTYAREGRGANLPPHYAGSSTYMAPQSYPALCTEKRLAFIADHLMLGVMAVSFLMLVGILGSSTIRYLYLWKYA
ncbi:MAG: hypothetical protein EOP83_08145 [Verrucomicrobiaceae bacterium]|nr:MAG: hypothetical protein EOP83_08145 [Verrucomicrobiaceae bacterium]